MAVGKIPTWFLSWISEPELAQIDGLVTELEKRTSGEVVIVVVKSSVDEGVLRIVSFLGWVIFSLFLLFVTLPFLNLVSDEFVLQHPYWMWLMALGTSFLLSFLINRFDSILRRIPGSFYFGLDQGMFRAILKWFFPASVLTAQALQRAELEFYREKIDRTTNRSGVLVFISLFEHRVIILGDQAIHGEVGSQYWQQCVDELVSHIKKGQLARGLEQCLRQMLELMIQKFPETRAVSPNELSNLIRFKD